MRLGVHLPQFGRAASATAITAAARQAERLGFAHVWVSDHLGVPDGSPYPPAFIYEPLITLTWAAAATSSIGLGTSVLVIPYRRPLHLAKELASIDRLSGGRLLVAAGSGWLVGEFQALDVPFRERGRRTDEGIAALRACWSQRVVNFEGTTVSLKGLRVVPQPDRPIPIWIGGASVAALDRAVRIGTGWHGLESDPDAIAEKIGFIRQHRPEDEFRISNRINCEPSELQNDEFAGRVEAFEAVGVQDLIIVPSGADFESWLLSVDRIAEITAPGESIPR
jgi:probable F420-dependent oxidoreductase